jgi:hypothetical protein
VESVYSAVRTESLYKTDTLRLWRVKLGTRWVSVVNVTPRAALPPLPGKEPPYPFNIRLRTSQNRSGRFAEEKNLFTVPGFEPDITSRGCKWYWEGKAKHICRIILSPVACLALPYFSTLSHKSYDFRGKKSVNIKCVFWFSLQLLSEIFLILRKIQRDIVINVHRSSCKASLILVRL